MDELKPYLILSVRDVDSHVYNYVHESDKSELTELLSNRHCHFIEFINPYNKEVIYFNKNAIKNLRIHVEVGVPQGASPRNAFYSAVVKAFNECGRSSIDNMKEIFTTIYNHISSIP